MRARRRNYSAMTKVRNFSVSQLSELAETRMRYYRSGLQTKPEPPHELTRKHLEPYLTEFGITRVGDTTGLDRIGIPVWFACRPASLSLCVSQGKGLTNEQAWVSAVIESIECFYAEKSDRLVSKVATVQQMHAAGLRTIPLELQSRCAACCISDDQTLAWVEGISWKTGETIFAPFELVGMDMSEISPWDRTGFRMSSVGLAAGGSLRDALIHGLQELVEDDAFYEAALPSPRRTVKKTMRFSGDAAAKLCFLVKQIEQAELTVRFCDMTNEFGIPAILAALEHVNPLDINRTFHSGYACRPNVEDAAIAAVLEAIQSRLTLISGGRDDLLAAEYATNAVPQSRSMFADVIFAPAESQMDQASAGALQLPYLVDRLNEHGIRDVYAFSLGSHDCGLHVARVLADGLVSAEAPIGAPRTGRAARKVLERWLEP